MIYKRALTEQALATARKVGEPKPDPLDEIFVTDAPGYGDLTLRQFKALPSGDREYITYVMATRELGEEPMSQREFEKIPDKDKVPTTAMGAAIARYVEETGKLPPEFELKRWTEMFREKPREPQVTWTTATRELTKRFGRLDPTGMWTITSELQSVHRLAQKALVALRDKGIDPLRAVNVAEDAARKYYQVLESIEEEANKIKDEELRRKYILEQTRTVNRIFERDIGFNPGG